MSFILLSWKSKSVINARPITYLYDDQEGISSALSPSHLIYGRKVTNMPNTETFDIISTHQSLSWRSKHHKNVLSQLVNQWRREYSLNLRKHHPYRCKREGKSTIELGDVIILKCDSSNREFWRLGVVEKLLLRSDDKVRAAIVKVGNTPGNHKTTYLRSSIKHLYPIEVRAQAFTSSESVKSLSRSAGLEEDSGVNVSNDSSKEVDPEVSELSADDINESEGLRPCRWAGEMLWRSKK